MERIQTTQSARHRQLISGSGVVELIAALLLLILRTVTLGAVLALDTINGALLSHFLKLGLVIQDDGGLLFGLALVVFLGSAIVLFLHRRDIPIISDFSWRPARQRK